MARHTYLELDTVDPTGRNRVEVVDDSHRSDSETAYVRIDIGHTPRGSDWRNRIEFGILLTDADAATVRGAPDAWLRRHDPPAETAVPDHSLR